MKVTIITLWVVLSMSIPAYSQQILYNKKSRGDSLHFRFIMPYKMKLKIIKDNNILKTYEFKGTKDLEIITKLRNVVIYSDSIEVQFYILEKGQKLAVPIKMKKNEIIHL